MNRATVSLSLSPSRYSSPNNLARNAAATASASGTTVFLDGSGAGGNSARTSRTALATHERWTRSCKKCRRERSKPRGAFSRAERKESEAHVSQAPHRGITGTGPLN